MKNNPHNVFCLRSMEIKERLLGQLESTSVEKIDELHLLIMRVTCHYS